jgi:carboxyl-terminal processing protease
MKSDTSPGRKWRSRAAITVVVMLIFVSGIVTGHTGMPVVGAADSLQNQDAFKAFEQAWQLIHDNYVVPESIDDEALIHGATKGMVDALGDTGHSTYLTPLEVETTDPGLTGEYVGVGISFDFTGSYPRVAYTLPGGPADKAGVLPGYLLSSVDGQRLDGLSASEVSTLLRGEEGSSVELQFLRDGESKLTLNLIRSRITVDPVSWWMLPGHVAQLRLEEFSSGASEEMKTAIADATAAGATSFILDLRSNPGGLVDEAEKIGGLFLPEGSTLYQERDRNGDTTNHAVQGGTQFGFPLAVLIDSRSASAAEILAASISENGVGTTIGDTTFGTGTVLNGFPLSDGGLLVLGTRLWLTPNGTQIWKVGVTPDIPVTLDNLAARVRPDEGGVMTASAYKASKDTQLEAAVDWIDSLSCGR